MTGRHSAGAADAEPEDPRSWAPPAEPIPPLSARRPDRDEPPMLPDAVPSVEPLGMSVRMFLVALGIGVGTATALSLASLLPR